MQATFIFDITLNSVHYTTMAVNITDSSVESSCFKKYFTQECLNKLKLQSEVELKPL